ncbi:hypothetical protein SAMN05443245_5399 [Paraburkholderia fungorum]|uniref:Uncharacterized protein n=1 Tax=Paraburkholderia fungorum TaxID=134537 RepID=A0A1H1IMT7_9BURK|nr:hypothetical protein SAMN05443245_5399 [Paraburkholderia fungorum]
MENRKPVLTVYCAGSPAIRCEVYFGHSNL